MSHQGGIDKSSPMPANDQYIKPIAERARELAEVRTKETK